MLLTILLTMSFVVKHA